ncbi:hypothetical protein LCGC14_3020000 [marine sediment metagenome]|uniref:Uncharacterized protein n=1 Tax=marine sediment metagenome TaxID=412755 RepID=A0A0F8WVP1_9ZZZZ
MTKENPYIDEPNGYVWEEGYHSRDELVGELLEACGAVPKILYGLGLDDPRQAMVAQKAIDVCRAALAKAKP